MEFLLESNSLFNGLKSMSNLRPAFKRQFTLRNTDIVLNYLSDLECDLYLKDLWEKVVVSFCLQSGQRDQAIKELNIKYTILENGTSPRFW